MIRIFCDANILFAAAVKPDGRSSALIDLGTTDQLLASAHVIEEARRNIVARYPNALERFESLLERLTIVGEGAPDLVRWAGEQGLPAQDAPVLAAAIQARADALATGDRTHFGHMFGRSMRGVEVLTLRDALAKLIRD